MLTKPESLNILISINMNIAKGLAEHNPETQTSAPE